ncbi:acyl-CoA dehydrogenase family protein [Janthinobacterium aquaticum]|uniref:acyl-CoA dehydrogenase family protein n=1 Tax=Janthinobacterium sp. FT58W TaxID=2654254 RepID=UPI00126567F0|nr:acyl-CoA dehydrogenase [Janthinobacterium sp. FT58W]KAB8045019.1 pimeloyl-CoA dehydrogenase small subunit [Janthinobacterium sp. FT58W]
MDFTLNQDQQQLADALRRWLDKEYAFERRRAIVHSDSGVSHEAWDGLVELGLTALPLPGEAGGFDGTAADLLPVMQALGRALLVEPYFATIWGARFLALGGRHLSQLEQVAQGSLRLACALGERQARHDLHDIVTTAVANGEGFVLDGEKTVVLHGAQAGALIVSARSGGGQYDQDGISLFLVPTDAPGVTLRDYRTIDGQRAATVTLVQVVLGGEALIGQAGQGWPLLDAAADYATALLCAEAVGAMEALFEATLDYLKTRQQFGAPIGQFQALQHRMADVFIHLEQARSMAMLAVAQADSAEAQERRRAVSAAKARVSQAATFVGQQAVQLHGGMGVTDELPASHHFKRLSMIALTLGDAQHHLERFVAQPGFLPAEGA